MSSMFELCENYNTLLSWLSDPEVDEEAIEDTLDSVKYDITEKSKGYAYLLKDMDGYENMLKDELNLISDKISLVQRRKDKLKKAVYGAMVLMDEKEIKAGPWTFKIVKNGGIQPMEVDEQNVPDTYKKIVYQTDNAKIRKALEAGEELPFAKLLPRGESLRIK